MNVYRNGIYIILIVSILIGTVMLSKKFRNEKYPIYNFALGAFFRFGILQPIYRTKLFFPEDVIAKKVTFRPFRNVLFDYKANGDFAKQLRKISILPYNDKEDTYTWRAVIEFNKTPKDGTFKIKFV